MNVKDRLVILTLALLAIQCNAKKGSPQPVSVIFDTDVGNDIDDVLALQMLFNYEKQNKARLLGITISKSNPRVIEYIDGYCRLNKRPGIPLGYAYNGVNPEPGKYVARTLDTLIEGKKVLYSERSIADSLPDGYLLQRKLLAAAPDKSVVMIVVGPQTNVARLLDSKPDNFSPLNGVDLVKQKVRLISVMGGLYTAEFNFPEWNIVQDLPAAKMFFEKCPVQVVASGLEIGDKFRYPSTSIVNDFTNGERHPLVVSYKIYEKMPYDRETWDLTSVLYALEPEKNFFDLSEPGKISVAIDGRTVFSPGPGQHRILIYKKNQQEVLTTLVKQVTGNQ